LKKIITYNLSDNLILSLADHLEHNYIRQGRDISRLGIVFGGKRPALFLKKELASRVKKSFLPPKFFTIDEFVEYIILKDQPLRKISELDASYIIYQLAKELAPEILKNRESFSQFLPWAKEISAFIEQLDLEDIKGESLRGIQSKAEIGYDVPENINSLLQSIVSIREAFHASLGKQQAYSRGLKYLSAAKMISGGIDFPEFDQVLFCGFFYLHKTEETVIKTIYQKDLAALFMQGDAKDWPVLQKMAKNFAEEISPQKPRPPHYELYVSAGFDSHSQVCLAREALKGFEKMDNTLIMLPNPENVIPLLSEITSLSGDLNVSMGYPLKRSSLYSLFECIFMAQETKKGEAYYAKDYLLTLANPLVKNLDFFHNPSVTRVLVHKIEEVLIGMEETSLGGSLFVRLSQIEHLKELYELAMQTVKSMGLEVTYDELKAAVKQLHALLFADWEGVDNFLKLSLTLENLLLALVKNSHLGDYPLNLLMAEKILAIKQELGGSAFNREIFPREEIFKVFENKLESEMISFSGSPLKGLQVLGLFETRCLNFENVIVLDVNEAALPNLKIYEPLIPREVMISLGLNRLESEEEIQRYQFMRLISSAKKVVLIYQESSDKEKSRFIEELIWQKQKEAQALEVIFIPKALFKSGVLPKKLEIPKNPGMIEFLKTREYSASSVNTYLKCPLRFYYQYVLGLKEKEDMLEDPEAKDIGTFVHQLLEDQFRGFINRKPVIDAGFEREFFAQMDKKFAEDFSRKMKSDAFLIKGVLDFGMRRFLNNERQRPVKEIFCLEKVFTGNLELKNGRFKFKAIFDRIDRLEDGSILILDYKTGGSDILPDADCQAVEAAGFSRKALKHTVKSFQLPLYLYLAQVDARLNSEVFNACLYFIKEPGIERAIKPIFRKTEHFANQEMIMQVYFKALDALLGEILDPGICFQADAEDARHCVHCPFFYLCR